MNLPTIVGVAVMILFFSNILPFICGFVLASAYMLSISLQLQGQISFTHLPIRRHFFFSIGRAVILSFFLVILLIFLQVAILPLCLGFASAFALFGVLNKNKYGY